MAESTKQRAAFEIYWRLGSERSIERTREELLRRYGRARSIRTLYIWSSRYQWKHQIARLEYEARVAENEVRVAEIKEMYERQAKAGLLMQQKGTEWLLSIDRGLVDANAALKAIFDGAKLERIARGQPGERQEIQGELETRLSLLEDAAFEALLRLVEGGLEGGDQAAPS